MNKQVSDDHNNLINWLNKTKFVLISVKRKFFLLNSQAKETYYKLNLKLNEKKASTCSCHEMLIMNLMKI